MTEIHKNEPSLDELRKIMKEVASAESTEDNVRKLKAIMAQIARHEVAEGERKAAEKLIQKTEETLE